MKAVHNFRSVDQLRPGEWTHHPKHHPPYAYFVMLPSDTIPTKLAANHCDVQDHSDQNFTTRSMPASDGKHWRIVNGEWVEVAPEVDPSLATLPKPTQQGASYMAKRQKEAEAKAKAKHTTPATKGKKGGKP